MADEVAALSKEDVIAAKYATVERFTGKFADELFAEELSADDPTVPKLRVALFNEVTQEEVSFTGQKYRLVYSAVPFPKGCPVQVLADGVGMIPVEYDYSKYPDIKGTLPADREAIQVNELTPEGTTICHRLFPASESKEPE